MLLPCYHAFDWSCGKGRTIQNMDVLLANRNVFINTKGLTEYLAAEEARRTLLSDLINVYSSAVAGLSDGGGNVETFGGIGKSKIAAAEDEKENFLMPAPRGRPRNRKRNTKDELEDLRISKSSRVTRSSKMSEIISHEATLLVKKGRKTKSSVKKSSMSEQYATISILETLDTSVTTESRKEGGKWIDSPLISSKNKIGLQKHDVVVESMEEEADQEVSAMEVVEDVQIEEILDSRNIIEESGTPEESKNIELHACDQVFVQKSKGKKMSGYDENEADDKWMTDDEVSKTPKTAGQNSSISSGTPKVKTSASKASQEALGAYKGLRSRKVKKLSNVSLTLCAKAKMPKTAELVKPPEIDTEADLKKQKEIERQNDALRRKEELLKKRREITKKKREEKMTKVKRTREEKEKEKEVKKLKKAKLLEGKKKSAMAEAVTTKTPIIEDVPPKQPDNPNDFGIADHSDSSSEEETYPPKKIPLWAQIKSNDNLLLTHCLLPVSIIIEYWQSKPRAPTIREFFGNHVSSKTLRHGLNHRTSSAIWNTPPLKN